MSHEVALDSLLRGALRLAPGETPFPWQRRLLDLFLSGSVPSAIDIPTGLGKTAVMAIWLVARSQGAKVPRRLVYVVDRRAVVDQATTVAEGLREWVETSDGARRGLDISRTLPISTLRGRHVDNLEWLEDPSSIAVVVGTVDMIGSRLLFEGYHCSRKMRPYHAAMLGADALIVVDEAHLVPAFEAMVRTAVSDETLKAQPSTQGMVPASRVMSLSATGRSVASPFRLDEADLMHATAKRRLDARKEVRLADPVEGNSLAEKISAKAWELVEQGGRVSRVIVFVDSRQTAQDVKGVIDRFAKGDGVVPAAAVETELFVGGRRVAERERVAQRLDELGMIAGSAFRSDKPVIVIATSAGEVGVDLDADHAVMDLVEWERVVQRLGRVNRRGDGSSDIWIIPTVPDKKLMELLDKDATLRKQVNVNDTQQGGVDGGDDADEEEGKAPKRPKPDEGDRIARYRRREGAARAVRHLPKSGDAYVANPRALGNLKAQNGTLVEEASTPAPLHPALTRAVVESWSMTSLEEHTGRPSVWPWLRGWVEEEAQTVVVWRRYLPKPTDAAAFFEAAAVELVEMLELESTLILDWLGKRTRQVAQDSADEALTPDDLVMFVLGDKPRGWTLRELSALDKRERNWLLRDLSGATVVVDVRLGGLDGDGLLDARSDGATDVSEVSRLSFRVREVDDLAYVSTDEHWRVEATFASRVNAEGEPITWLVVESDRAQQAMTADGRSTGKEQALAEHLAFAERHARAIGSRVGLPPNAVDLLALAAVLHDEGKKADRWQRAFRAPTDRRPLAKTMSRPIQSILAGYRHEFGSILSAEHDPRVSALPTEDRDLLLHIIAAHHGFARPFVRTDGCEDAPPSALIERAQTIALRFARLERRWGPWGLAWWEALLRAADQGASRENDGRGGVCG